jgi:RHS repeat-associated protein
VVDNNNGATLQQLDYYPYGRVIVDTNPGFQPFGYAGGLYERDTGLVRFGRGDYDPAVGRWTSKDPIGFAGGLNLYGYVVQDLVNNFDPTGLDTVGIVGAHKPWSANTAGHVAMAITGSGMFSFGKNTEIGANVVDHVSQQSKVRDQYIYIYD